MAAASDKTAEAVAGVAPLLTEMYHDAKWAYAQFMASKNGWPMPSDEEKAKMDADQFILISSRGMWLTSHGLSRSETLCAAKKTVAFDDAFSGGRGMVWNTPVRCAYCDAGMQTAADAASPKISKSQAMLKHYATCPKIP